MNDEILIDAIQNNHMGIAREILNSPQFNSREHHNYYSILIAAVKSNNIDITKTIIEKFQNIDIFKMIINSKFNFILENTNNIDIFKLIVDLCFKLKINVFLIFSEQVIEPLIRKEKIDMIGYLVKKYENFPVLIIHVLNNSLRNIENPPINEELSLENIIPINPSTKEYIVNLVNYLRAFGNQMNPFISSSVINEQAEFVMPETCSICLDPLANKSVIMLSDCKHIFHKNA
jgi:hypothetical protein